MAVEGVGLPGVAVPQTVLVVEYAYRDDNEREIACSQFVCRVDAVVFDLAILDGELDRPCEFVFAEHEGLTALGRIGSALALQPPPRGTFWAYVCRGIRTHFQMPSTCRTDYRPY